jgi:hypothetical protein
MLQWIFEARATWTKHPTKQLDGIWRPIKELDNMLVLTRLFQITQNKKVLQLESRV